MLLHKTFLFSLIVLLGTKASGGHNLPIFQKSADLPIDDSKLIDSDDIILDESSLPKELLEGLEEGEIVETITVSVDNKQRSVDLRKDEGSLSGEAIQLTVNPEEEKLLIEELLTEAIKGEETSRSASNGLTIEEDRQNFLSSGLTRRQLLELLGDTRNLDTSVPANRGFVRQFDDPSRIQDLTKKITINENNLPGVRQPDGTVCIEKVFLVNETEYERGVKCHHTFKKKCHLTYITDYHSAPEKKCGTTFKKNCHITFKPVPHTEKVKKCHTPVIKECGDGIQGPEVCTTQYETHCETTYKNYELEQDEPNCRMVEELRCNKEPVELLHLPHSDDSRPFAEKERCEKWPVQKCDLEKKNVKKIHPVTECKKIPRKVCTPSNCKTRPGQELCHEDTRTQIQNIPEEDCDLEPQEHCSMETSLVPRLVPKKNCVKVPKEICVNTKKNPKQVTKPVLKNWCYDPQEIKKSIEEY